MSSSAVGVNVRANAPNFTASCIDKKTKTTLTFSTFKGKYLVLFFVNFTYYVCPTEITSFSDRISDFNQINTQVICGSCDSSYVHLAYVNTPRNKGGLGDVNFPIISDYDKKICTSYGILTDDGVPLRALFIISPQGKILHITINDLPVGRCVDEILRLVKAFQHYDEHGELCPANWKPGHKAIKVAKATTRSTVGEGVTEGNAATSTTVTQSDEILLSTLAQKYHEYKTVYPLASAMLTSCVVACAGDLIASVLRGVVGTKRLGRFGAYRLSSRLPGKTAAVAAKSGGEVFSMKRFVSFGLYGLLIRGPVNHWRENLRLSLKNYFPTDLSFKPLKEQSLSLIWLCQLIIDRLIFTPSLVAILLWILGLLRHL